MLTAILRASSSVSSLAAESPPRLILEIDIGELLPVLVTHDKAGVQFFDKPRRREAAGQRHIIESSVRLGGNAELNGDWAWGTGASRRQDNNTARVSLYFFD
jgi:hypothetical protein